MKTRLAFPVVLVFLSGCATMFDDRQEVVMEADQRLVTALDYLEQADSASARSLFGQVMDDDQAGATEQYQAALGKALTYLAGDDDQQDPERALRLIDQAGGHQRDGSATGERLLVSGLRQLAAVRLESLESDQQARQEDQQALEDARDEVRTTREQADELEVERDRLASELAEAEETIERLRKLLLD